MADSSGKKRVAVVGGGGREHALCWKLAQSERVAKVFSVNGSIRIGQLPKVEVVKAGSGHSWLVDWCKQQKVDLVVVGPEAPLADGLADSLRAGGIPCFGPIEAGAQIECDKSWSKDFMKRFQIPTARFEIFDDVDRAKAFIKRYLRGYFFSRGMENLYLC